MLSDRNDEAKSLTQTAENIKKNQQVTDAKRREELKRNKTLSSLGLVKAALWVEGLDNPEKVAEKKPENKVEVKPAEESYLSRFKTFFSHKPEPAKAKYSACSTSESGVVSRATRIASDARAQHDSVYRKARRNQRVSEVKQRVEERKALTSTKRP